MRNVTTKRPITLEDVAKAAGIAKSTASMALNGHHTIAPATREAVRRVAADLGFEPNVHARRLSGQAHGVVGLFCANLEWSAGTHKLHRIQQSLIRHGLDAPAYIGTTDEAIQTEMMRSLRLQRPRAIICDSSSLSPAATREINAYQQSGGIVVCHDWDVNGLDCDRVVFDREDNAYQAARFLLQSGHRKLGLYNNSNGVEGPRLTGFRRALAEFNVPLRSEWLFYGFYEDGGAAMAEAFLTLPDRPTALYIVNDYAAAAFVSTVRRAGVSVPEGVSVVSSANLPITRHSDVPLTSTTYPFEVIAESVVDLLTDRLSGTYTGPSRAVRVGSSLIVRQSTAAAPPLS